MGKEKLKKINFWIDSKACLGFILFCFFKLKNSVPQCESIDPGIGYQQRNFSRHHIYPNAHIFDMPDIFDRLTVQNYVNQPHIKRIIRENGLAQKFKASEIIHTAIGFNPNNLVHGPSRAHRANDPADETGKHNLNLKFL